MVNLKLSIYILIVVLMPLIAHAQIIAHAQNSKSYMQMEVMAPSNSGPIIACDGNVGLWVEWNADESILTMMDGTNWIIDYIDKRGYKHYKFKDSDLSIMPGATYHEAVLIPDKTKLQVIYTFGMMGHNVKMYATYGYIGEGKQPAIDLIGDKDDEFNYANEDQYRTFVKTKNKCSKCSGCSGYRGYRHGNGIYEGSCSNSDGHGHTCGHGPEKHDLRRW